MLNVLLRCSTFNFLPARLHSSLSWNFKETATLDKIMDLLINGDRTALAKTITLLESTRRDHRIKSNKLLESIIRHNSKNQFEKPSFRIGLTGPPGAGKSTFIEKFGMMLLNKELESQWEANNHRLAVLAVDPSSKRTKGSLLGDKTRMTELSYHPDAFIRPSSSGTHLGGVARATNENILLCEAAKYNVILVETVGVGQSEYSVADMVDLFVLIIPPAGGDELQGIKKGIIEYVDMVVVNKCDGDLRPAARRVASEYNSALKYSHSQHNDWKPKVVMLSSESGNGIQDFWDTANEFLLTRLKNKTFFRHRKSQILNWMNQYIDIGLRSSFDSDKNVKNIIEEVKNLVKEGELTPGMAADILLDKYTNKS